jgi:hypothetical protein
VMVKASKRVRPIVKAFIEAVDDAERLQLVKREATTLRTWGAAHGDRVPRWLPRMKKVLGLVAAATEAHGRERYDILVEAAKIVVALREPRADLLMFQRSEWFLEVAIGTIGDCAGCLAMRSSCADPRLSARIKRVVNKADPQGLLRAGAPDDEYHPEIDEIACRLPEKECRTASQTQTVVRQVFIKWFGVHAAGPRSGYEKLATALHALRPTPRAEARARLKNERTKAKVLREWAELSARTANGKRQRRAAAKRKAKVAGQLDRRRP